MESSIKFFWLQHPPRVSSPHENKIIRTIIRTKATSVQVIFLIAAWSAATHIHAPLQLMNIEQQCFLASPPPFSSTLFLSLSLPWNKPKRKRVSQYSCVVEWSSLPAQLGLSSVSKRIWAAWNLRGNFGAAGDWEIPGLELLPSACVRQNRDLGFFLSLGNDLWCVWSSSVQLHLYRDKPNKSRRNLNSEWGWIISACY